jgi:hypothetical protein
MSQCGVTLKKRKIPLFFNFDAEHFEQDYQRRAVKMDV